MAETSSIEEEDPQDEYELYGTPPVRTGNGIPKLSAGRMPRHRSSSTRLRHQLAGSGSKSGRPVKMSAAERKRSKDRWQRDRGQARAFKVLDPMLLDVLGIGDAQKESPTNAAGDGLASPSSGHLALSGSQLELMAHQRTNSQDDLGGGMHRSSSSRSVSSQKSTGRYTHGRGGAQTPPAGTSRRPAPVRTSPAAAATPGHHHQRSASATGPAAPPSRGSGSGTSTPRSGVIPASTSNAVMAPLAPATSWAMAVAAPPRPPSAPPPSLTPAAGQAPRWTGNLSPAALAAMQPLGAQTVPVAAPGPRQLSSSSRISQQGALSAALSGATLDSLSARDRVVQVRQNWLARIDDALVGRDELDDDLDGGASQALAEAMDGARSIKDQLTVLPDTSDSWQQLEDRLKWLETCRSQAADIMKHLEPHKPCLDSTQLQEVRAEYMDQMAFVADSCAQTAADFLEALPGKLKAEEDLRTALRISHRTIQACVAVGRDQRDCHSVMSPGAHPDQGSLTPGHVGNGSHSFEDNSLFGSGSKVSMERSAARVVHAAMSACSKLASMLLTPASLKPPVGHATSTRVRCMTTLWRGTNDLLLRVTRQWESQQLELNKCMAEVYRDAASLALYMIVSCMCSRTTQGGAHLRMLLEDGGAAGGSSFEAVLALLLELDEQVRPGTSTASSSIPGSMMGSVVGSGTSSTALRPAPAAPAAAIGWMTPPSSAGGPGAVGQGRPGSASAGRASAWGVNSGIGKPRSSLTSIVLSDDELLAHSWVPNLLMDLHTRAAAVHKRLRELLVAASAGTPSGSMSGMPSLGAPGNMSRRPTLTGRSGSSSGLHIVASMTSCDEADVFGLLDEMQERFSSLVLANLQRTAWLCAAVMAPAMWALEKLREQAEQALRLVKAYDASSLGLEEVLLEALEDQELNGTHAGQVGSSTGVTDSEGEQASEADMLYTSRGARRASRNGAIPDRLQAVQCVFELLRHASDRVTSALLHIRRQLRVRKVDQADDLPGLPARLPAVPPQQPAVSQHSIGGLGPTSTSTQPARPGRRDVPASTAAVSHHQAVAGQQQGFSTAHGNNTGQQRHSSPFARHAQVNVRQVSVMPAGAPPAAANGNSTNPSSGAQQQQAHPSTPPPPPPPPRGPVSPFSAGPSMPDFPVLTPPAMPRTSSPFSAAPLPAWAQPAGTQGTEAQPAQPWNPPTPDITAEQRVTMHAPGTPASGQQLQGQQQHQAGDVANGLQSFWHGDGPPDSRSEDSNQGQATGPSYRSILLPANIADAPASSSNVLAQAAQSSRQGSLLTQQLAGQAMQGTNHAPASMQAGPNGTLALPDGPTVSIGPIDEDREEEAAAAAEDGESTWKQPRQRRRAPRAAPNPLLLHNQADLAMVAGRGSEHRGRRGGGSGRGGFGGGRRRGGSQGARAGRTHQPFHVDTPLLQSVSAGSASSGSSAAAGPTDSSRHGGSSGGRSIMNGPAVTGRSPQQQPMSAFAGFTPPHMLAQNSSTGGSPSATPKLASSPIQAPRAPPAVRPLTPHRGPTSPFQQSTMPPGMNLIRTNSGHASGQQVAPQHQQSARPAATQQPAVLSLARTSNGPSSSSTVQATHAGSTQQTVTAAAATTPGAAAAQTAISLQRASSTHLQAAAVAAGAGGSGGAMVPVTRPPLGNTADDAFWSIPFSVLRETLVEQLGSGSFGTVWRGRYYNANVAIKVVNIDRDALLDEKALARFRREVDFQRKLSHHPNIVRFIGACCEYEQACVHRAGNAVLGAGEPGPLLAIVMEYCMLGNLFRMVTKARTVGRRLMDPQTSKDAVRTNWPNEYAFYSSWETRLQVMVGAAAGVQFMHSHDVVHRDLTSNNLVLDRAVAGPTGGTVWVAKVCDFNLSRQMPSTAQLTNSGRMYSPLWASPELLGGGTFGKEADVYSFGIILYEVLTLSMPYAHLRTTVPYAELSAHDRDILIYNVQRDVPRGLRPELPASASQLAGPPLHADSAVAEQLYGRLRELIQACWQANPVDRPTMERVAAVLMEVLEELRRSRAPRHSTSQHRLTQQQQPQAQPLTPTAQ